MLDKVLKNVATSDLLNCRRVNSQWNAISSHVLRRRCDVQLHFAFLNGKFMQKVPDRNSSELIDLSENLTTFGSKSLPDLVDCLKCSENFPFSNFRFDHSYDHALRKRRISEDISEFIAIFGENIEAIEVPIDSELILEKFPNVKKLKIRFRDYISRDFAFEHCVESDEMQLPKLEVLCVDKFDGYREFRNTIAYILNAAPNLKEFVGSLDGHGITVEDYVMLQSLGKLHCLKDVKIVITDDWIVYWKKFHKCMDLELHSLNVSFDVNHQTESNAAEMINQLLRSSKGVIRTLSIEQPALIGLVTPILENLQHLSLFFDHGATYRVLSHMADTFPNVKSLGKEMNTIILSVLDWKTKYFHFRDSYRRSITFNRSARRKHAEC